MELRTSSINIAYVGGGSKGWAWGLMSDLALDGNLCGTVKLYDVNYEAAFRNEVIGNRISALPNTNSQWHYKAVRTLQEALVDADFVIISILPGTFQEMYSDVHVPEKYDIYQAVGDTTGPGGLTRALRTIPMYAEIATNIKALAPDAWVINYTNPMSLCLRTLYEVFPEIKAIGCCHGVFEVQELLVQVLRELKGITAVTRKEINTNVLGINHFTWIDRARYQDVDLFPLYDEFSALYHDGYEYGDHGDGTTSFFSCANRVQFDLFRRYKLIPCPSDRHLVEFVPWYLHGPEEAHDWKFGLTPVSWRIDRSRELERLSTALVEGTIEPEVKPSGEEGVLLIKALLGLGNIFTNLNLPNEGQIDGLPRGAVVETNALISRNRVKPVFAGKLPTEITSLVTRQLLNYETILTAGLKQDKQLAFSAFLNDPLMHLDLNNGWQLFNEMIQDTANYHKML